MRSLRVECKKFIFNIIVKQARKNTTKMTFFVEKIRRRKLHELFTS